MASTVPSHGTNPGSIPGIGVFFNSVFPFDILIDCGSSHFFSTFFFFLKKNWSLVELLSILILDTDRQDRWPVFNI